MNQCDYCKKRLGFFYVRIEDGHYCRLECWEAVRDIAREHITAGLELLRSHNLTFLDKYFPPGLTK